MLKFFKNTNNVLAAFLILGLILSPFLFFREAKAEPAGNVQFTADTIIELTGNPATLYSESASECDSLEVSGATLTSTIGDAQNFTLKTASYKVLKLTPSGGSLTLTFDSANFSTSYILQWNEESAIPGLTTAHIVGVSKANTNYAVLVDDSVYGIYQSSASSEISFTYSGGYTAKVFKINEAPSITSVSDSPDPIAPGSNITFTVNWTDPNSDQTKTHICKTSAISGQICGGGSWCDTTSWSASSPSSCSYNVQASDMGTNNYYAFVCDTNNACSSSSSGTFTVQSEVTNFTCSVTSGSCSGTTILKMQALTNSHAELSSQGNYNYYVCCSGLSGLGNSCSGNYDTALKLSGTTNAHVEKKTQLNYSNSACLSIENGAVTCDYSTACSDLGSVYACLASISGDTNAHIGDCNAYSTKVCCRVLLGSGAACASNAECVSGNCVADYDGTGNFCCDTTSCAHNGACFADTSCSGAYKCNSGSWANHCTNSIKDCDETQVDVGVSCDDPSNCSGYAWSENIGWLSFSCKNLAPGLASFNSGTGDMLGYAWSENIGWVSMSSDNCANNSDCTCPPDTSNPACTQPSYSCNDTCALLRPYQVNIAPATGNLTGYGWSENIGWVSFNDYDAQHPQANYNSTTKKFSGWARAIRDGDGGGWDGWLKFGCEGTECDTSNYYVYGNEDNELAGWSWGSDVIGWLWFGGVCVKNYGVHIDNYDDYKLLGHAWSDKIGWLSFNRSETGAPPAAPFNGSENYIAKFDMSTKQISGWARALAYSNAPDGGWDGWVKLRGTVQGGGDYGLSIETNSKEFRGWAWGGDVEGNAGEEVIGLVSFNDKDYDGEAGPIDYQVKTTLNWITVSDTSETWAYCDDSRHPILNWTVSDGAQASYWIQINDVDSFDDSCTGCEVNTNEVASTSNSYTTAYNFNWNTTYYWRVKVKDSYGAWSLWKKDSNGFTTPLNAYPSPNFSNSPQTVRTNEFTQFQDTSTCFDSDNTCNSWTWTFEGAANCYRCSDPACEDNTCLDGTEGQPETYDTCTEQGTAADPVGVKWKTLPSGNNVDVELEACDVNHYCCPEEKNISIMYYPEWREISPW